VCKQKIITTNTPKTTTTQKQTNTNTEKQKNTNADNIKKNHKKSFRFNRIFKINLNCQKLILTKILNKIKKNF